MAALISGFDKFEDGRNAVKNADFKSLETFIKQYLNTADKKQRSKLSEEFKKRHLELYEFLKENSELVNAETQISKIIHDVSNPKSDNANILNKLDEVLRGIEDEF